MKHHFRFFLAVLILTLGAGCMKYAKHLDQRFFWPPYGMAEPKIELLNYYTEERDVTRQGISWLEDQLLGVPDSVPLFSRPLNLVSDGEGRVFVSDPSKKVVFVLDLNKHQIRYLLDTESRPYHFAFAYALTVTPDGDVYVADVASKAIYHFDKSEKLVRAFEDQERFDAIKGIAFDNKTQRFYIVNSRLHTVLVYDNAWNLVNEIGGRGDEDDKFNYPLDVDLDQNGNLYVLDSLNFKVKVFSPDGTFIRSFGSQGTLSGSFQIPKNLAVSPSGHVYVTDSRKHAVIVFDVLGNYLLTLGGYKPRSKGQITPGGFAVPGGIAADRNDQIWLADTLNRTVHQFQFLTEGYLSEHPLGVDEGVVAPVGNQDLEEK